MRRGTRAPCTLLLCAAVHFQGPSCLAGGGGGGAEEGGGSGSGSEPGGVGTRTANAAGASNVNGGRSDAAGAWRVAGAALAAAAVIV